MRRSKLGDENPETAKSRELLIGILEQAGKGAEANILRAESAG
jgi:hypothetical protein